MDRFLHRVGLPIVVGWLDAAGLGPDARELYAEIRELCERLRHDDRSAFAFAERARAVGLAVTHGDEFVSLVQHDAARRLGAMASEFRGLLEQVWRTAMCAARAASRAGDLAASVLSSRVRLCPVRPFESTMTAKEAGALLWPTESLTTRTVCDRLRPSRAPRALRVFCPGGPGRSGRHFVRSVVLQVASEHRAELDRMSQNASRTRSKRRRAQETREYHTQLSALGARLRKTGG